MSENKKSDLVQYAYDTLKDQILTLKLTPGTILSDLTLSKQLNISRTPVREALNQLFTDQLVTVINNKWIVSFITLDDIKELFEARQAIECACAAILFQNGITNELKRELALLLKQQTENVVKTHDLALDFEFHLKIVKASKNSRLIGFYENLGLQISRLYWLTAFDDRWKKHTLDEHGHILDAINGDDVQTLQSAIAEHLALTQKNYVRILEATPFINVLSIPNPTLADALNF